MTKQISFSESVKSKGIKLPDKASITAAVTPSTVQEILTYIEHLNAYLDKYGYAPTDE